MPDPEQPLTFEQALAELEKIVHDLEDGQIGLEDSLARYEKGIGLLRQCYGQLQQVEQRIMVLTGIDAQGRPASKPFEHQAAEEQEKAIVTSRKKPEVKNEPRQKLGGTSELPF